ncbi:bifunctional metallophosphatase/5'-nucleotidase [Actinopolymorpha pittospori]|uniref:5'-nucleotidase n=1 Tax=Actinopolymorpha pittospori TaxID=648752 RepID=A0A927N7Y9_9ACTN|nr:bifunctional UDP-sugar hydrolase/5'-nucleotidase [Actinopolymorpha pittospori]MBE1610617.1 5'-nucleotidase [Actinopolymorpha pittospori]
MATTSRLRVATAGVALGVAALSVGLSAPAVQAQPLPPVDVQLLDITDFHGYITPQNDASNGTVPLPDGSSLVVGGAPYLATHLKQLAAGHRNSILFSTGDAFSGWPTEVAYHADEPTVEFFNQIGVEFSAIGNHELDISPSFVKDHMAKGKCFGEVDLDSCFTDSTGKRFHGSDFTYTSANITEKGSRTPIFEPYVIKRVSDGRGGSIPIGFISLTTETTVAGSTSYQPDLDNRPLVETANRYAAELKRRGVRAIVANVHEGGSAGGQFNGCSNPTGPVVDFARQATPDIDVIITGHWHALFNCTIDDPAGNPRPVVEAGFHGKLISETNLRLDRRTRDVIRDDTDSVVHPVTRDVPPDPDAAALVDYWQRRGGETAARPVAEITGDLTRVADPTGQSTLGNAIADATYEDSQRTNAGAGRADLALVVTKPHSGSNSLRGDLPYAPGSNPADAPGRVLFGEAWAAYGYANPVLTVSVTGAQIHQALEDQWRTQADGSVRFAPFGVSQNVHYSYDAGRPVGDRVDPADVLIDGQPLEPTRTYRLAALAYTLIAGDGTTAFAGFADAVRGTRDYEAFRGYLTRHSPLAPPALDRVVSAG